MMRRKGFGIPANDGGMEDANEQELEKLVKEVFYKDHADRNGDKTQKLSAIFNTDEETGERAEEKMPSPTFANSLPTVSEEVTPRQEERFVEEETDAFVDEDDGDSPRYTKSTGRSKGHRGGIYVAVTLTCLFISLALLVFNSREVETPSLDSTPLGTTTNTDAHTEAAPSSVITAEEIYLTQKNSSVTVCVYLKGGMEYLSGTVIWDGGYVVSVCSGISNAERVEIVSSDGKAYAAEVLGFDRTADLSLLKCESGELTPIERQDTVVLSAGERLYAIGTQKDTRFGGSLFEGVVSFEERCVELFDSEGNSRRAVTVGVGGLSCDTLRGSPVYDEYGRGVAMLWGDTEGDIGLVVPMTRVLAIAEFFRNGEIPDNNTLACIAYTTPSLGIVGENYSDGKTVGVLIKEFTSPVCDSALKLRKNDVMVSINGVAVKDTQSVKQTVYGFRTGDVVEIHVIRDSQLLSFLVELE